MPDRVLQPIGNGRSLIPGIIHQTWKTSDIPEEFRFFQRSWVRHHPGWEYRLWTDEDNREFIGRHYPWFLPVYDGYASAICRADAIRYFLLRHFGGVYADLDFECLQPFDELLRDTEALLGLEPNKHLEWHRHIVGDRTELACNALMASRPGHPFWDHVIACMLERRREPGPLAATGPIMLTAALATYRDRAPVRMTASELLYPLDSNETGEGQAFDLQVWVGKTSRSVAVHHWANTWVKKSPRDRSETSTRPAVPVAAAPVRILDRRMLEFSGSVHPRNLKPLDGPVPMVSCLMVTRDRAALARNAIRCFLDQTWPNRELVILDDSEDPALERIVQEFDDPRIRFLRIPPEGKTLGHLRNEAVALARGEYVCQWDDDDLYDPARIELQMHAILVNRAAACMLQRWTIWWPQAHRLASSRHRAWEGSLICRKDRMPEYPDLRRGEDTPVAETLLDRERVVLLDMPRLYIYRAHAGNTFDPTHFDAHWESATARFEGGDYARALQELAKRLDLNGEGIHPGPLRPSRAGAGSASSTRAADAGESVPSESGMSLQDPAPGSDTPGTESAESPDRATTRPGRVRAAETLRKTRDPLPSVLVLTPLKDAERFLPGYLRLLEALDYPADRLALGLLEGDSTDQSFAWLQDHRERLEKRARALTLLQSHHGNRLARNVRHAADDQYARRRILALCRNELFRQAYSGEDYVLWIDVDVIDYPATILHDLLAAEKPAVVPHCVLDSGGPTFDLNSFVAVASPINRPWSFARQSLIQPPRGTNRMYLDAFRSRAIVELDAVGATMLLLKAQSLVDLGITFPPYSYRGYIESEGLAMMARDRGVRCWGIPDLEIIHARE